MRCPFCGKNKDMVINSRASSDRNVVRRRRLCLSCKQRFTTYERIEPIKFYVIKKDGRREIFNREKVLTGIELACKKLRVPRQRIEDIATKVELEIYEKGKKEIPSSLIGDMVMAELKELNHVAYVRFASYYREFRDVSDFLKVAKEIGFTLKSIHKR
jgi:transcriptional repressor NrdR